MVISGGTLALLLAGAWFLRYRRLELSVENIN
jgi:hypothetical protein